MLAAVNATGQIPQQPAVGSSEYGAAAFGGLTDAVDILQDPLQLAAGEVGGRRQAGPMPDDITTAITIKVGGDLVRTGVLPDDRVPVWLTVYGIPDDRRFTLVGDPEPRQVGGTKIALCQGVLDDLLGALPDLHGIVLHPSCRGMICWCSSWYLPTSRPEWSKIMQRVLVVPWSIAATKSAMR